MNRGNNGGIYSGQTSGMFFRLFFVLGLINITAFHNGENMDQIF